MEWFRDLYLGPVCKGSDIHVLGRCRVCLQRVQILTNISMYDQPISVVRQTDRQTRRGGGKRFCDGGRGIELACAAVFLTSGDA
eukprot:752921-Hanusia_phi.AAC.4